MPRRALALAVVLTTLAAACTPAAETSDGTDPAPTTDGSAATRQAGESSPPGEGLATLAVVPPVAGPGDAVTVSAPFAGVIEMIGPDGTTATVESQGGEATLTIPADTATGEYVIVLRSERSGIGLGALRVADGPGLWLDADRLTVADSDLVRLRVTSTGVDPTTPILIGLGTGWEDEFGGDSLAEGDVSESGPAGVLTPTDSGLLVSGGFEPVPLGVITDGDLFLPGAEADSVQLISLGDDLLFSNPVPLTRCEEPALVSGSIGGPGGIRFVSVSGPHESIATATDTGEFSASIPAGPHMLFGWLDGEPPSALTPIPIDAPCGGSIDVSGATASDPSVAFQAPVIDNVFAVERPPCRSLLIDRIVGDDGRTDAGLAELVAGTLTSRLPLADVIALSDVDSIVEHAFDQRWPVHPGNLISLWGLGDRFDGDAYVTGVRHRTEGTLGAYPDTDRDAATLVNSQGTTADWVDSFAAAVAGSALCVQAPSIHAPAGSTVAWDVAVTDMAGVAYSGATVRITGGEDLVTPAVQGIGDRPATFTLTAGEDIELVDLTIEARTEVDGQSLATVATVNAGIGLTYVLAGAYQFRLDSTDVPIGGNLGAAVTACADRPGGPYRGIAVFELADFFQLAALGGALLATIGEAPAGGATPRLNPSDEVVTNELVGLLFGYRNQELAFDGSALAAEALDVLSVMLVDSGAIVGSIDDTVFHNGRITLLENDGNRVVGTLNPATNTVALTANGLKLMTATISVRDGCPVSVPG